MSGWTPVRPERGAPEWPASPRPVEVVPSDPAPSGPVHSGPQDPTRRPHAAGRLSRLSPARRVIAGFVVLAALITLVTGVGAAVTPVYGSLPPWRSTAVVDLRSAPTPDGWRVDLMRDALPGVPPRCASFQATTSSGRFVVLIASVPPLGSTSRCDAQTNDQVTSTVALFDSDAGRVLWSTDLSRRFGSVTLQDESVIPSAERVGLLFTIDGGTTIASLSMTTGRVIESRRLGDTGDFAGGFEGTRALVGVPVDGTADRWSLVDVRDLHKTMWSADLPDSSPPIQMRSGVFAMIDGRSMRIDGETGARTLLGRGNVALGNGPYDPDEYFSIRVVSSGVSTTAWSDRGKQLWTRGGLGDVAGRSRDCVFATLPGTTTVTCIDRATGDTRWTKDLNSQGFPVSVTGQTTNDVAILRNFGNEGRAVVVDGDTGRTKYTLELLPQTQPVAASRTTGYLQSTTLTGTATAFTAFDTETGDILWHRSDVDGQDTELWGGRLVTVSSDGIARELVDRTPPALGAEQ